MPEPRRFPPPWTVEDIGACFIVKDSTAQKLAAGTRSNFRVGSVKVAGST